MQYLLQRRAPIYRNCRPPSLHCSVGPAVRSGHCSARHSRLFKFDSQTGDLLYASSKSVSVSVSVSTSSTSSQSALTQLSNEQEKRLQNDPVRASSGSTSLPQAPRQQHLAVKEPNSSPVPIRATRSTSIRTGEFLFPSRATACRVRRHAREPHHTASQRPAAATRPSAYKV